jgi:hypothetical protein
MRIKKFEILETDEKFEFLKTVKKFEFLATVKNLNFKRPLQNSFEFLLKNSSKPPKIAQNLKIHQQLRTKDNKQSAHSTSCKHSTHSRKRS